MNPVFAAQDKMTYSMRSHELSLAAIEAGRFEPEIVPVPVADRRGKVTMVTTDEGPRPGTSMEVLDKLKPVVKGGCVVTAGNASSLKTGPPR